MSLPLHQLVFNGFLSVQLENSSSQQLIPEEMYVHVSKHKVHPFDCFKGGLILCTVATQSAITK